MNIVTVKGSLRLLVGAVCCVNGQVYATPADVKLTFIELNDLHANLVGHKDQIRKPDGTIGVARRGGMARIKTMMDAARKSNPNTVVMNVGDTFHGGVEPSTRWATPWPTR